MYYLAEAQVIHWDGIATELDQTYAYRFSQFSHVHYLRKHSGPWAARTYKVLVTIDMPLRVLIVALTWFVKRLLGNRERAARDRRKLAAKEAVKDPARMPRMIEGCARLKSKRKF